jgi:penicillin-binding protein 1A
MGLFDQLIAKLREADAARGLARGQEPSFSGAPPANVQGSPNLAPHDAHAVVRRRVVRVGFVLGGTFIACLVLLCLALVMTTIAIPNPMVLRKEERAPVIRVLAADGSVLVERGLPYDYMPIDLLPRHVTDAIIATEDHRFFDHWGLDPIGLMRAMLTNLRAGRYAQGGSTLTQQLAKNLFLNSERRLGRKFEELYLALWLELRLSKKDILELYLNRVYFGGGAYGIEAASRRYFNKSARELSIIEAAVLGGVLKAPSKYSPLASPPLARSRARVVVQKMLAVKLITEEQAAHASNEVVVFHNPVSSREVTGLETAIDYALERLPPLANGAASEIVVETTLDGPLQKLAQQKLTAMIAAEGAASDVTQGSLVVLDPDGAIKVIVGGRAYAESQFNRAAKAKRQPGSAFKPFVYLSALESGLTPDSTVFDLPLTVKGWSPRNENGTFKGAMSLRQGLAQSVNSIAVRLHIDVGTKKTIEVANRLGIRSDLRDGPALALGTSEVTLLELTGAYATLASGGFRLEPHIIDRVRTGRGVVLYQRPVRAPVRVIEQAQVGQMNDMLNAALVFGTGRRAALDRHPAAGKTGTSQDFRDAWFVGYTTHLAGGVWFGNDNGRAMNKIMGGSMPARLWHDVMLAAHQGREPRALPGTETVIPTIQGPPPKPEVKPETKPVAAKQPAPKAAAAAVAPSAPKPVANAPPAPKLPSERIGDDFFARALADQGSAAPQPAAPAAVAGPRPADSSANQLGPEPAGAPVWPAPVWPAPVWNGFDASDIAAKIARTAPPTPAKPDMMSLGAKRP